MKKKDLIYIPHQDTWTERFPNQLIYPQGVQKH